MRDIAMKNTFSQSLLIFCYLFDFLSNLQEISLNLLKPNVNQWIMFLRLTLNPSQWFDQWDDEKFVFNLRIICYYFDILNCLLEKCLAYLFHASGEVKNSYFTHQIFSPCKVTIGLELQVVKPYLLKKPIGNWL